MKVFSSRLKFFFLGILFLASNNLQSQSGLTPENDPDFFDSVRFGGSLGLSFSNNVFSALLAPKAVYDFNRYFSLGVGIAGSYTDGSNFTAYTLGGSTIALFRPISMLQVSSEFEENYVNRSLELDGGNLTNSYWYPSLFLGLGYTTGPVTVGLKYDVLYNDRKSIYGNALMPFVSIYF